MWESMNRRDGTIHVHVKHCLQPQLGIYYKTTLIRMVHSGLGNRTDRKFKTQGGAIQGFWFTVALIGCQ